MTSNMARLVLFCVSLSALRSSVQGVPIINDQYFALLGPGPTDSPPLTDCPLTDNARINQAYIDALSLAGEARDQLRLGGSQPAQITRFYDMVFDGPESRPSTSFIADQFSGIASQTVLPSEIIFHCAPNWYFNLNGRKSNLNLFSGREGCTTDTDAVTIIILSGQFSSTGAQDPDYGTNGAFRTGTHIMLCPNFFALPPLSGISAPAVGSFLDNRDNQGMVVLHELMHAYSRSIKDGGYGYGGIVDVADGKPLLDDVIPENNADTYALFAMGRKILSRRGMREGLGYCAVGDGLLAELAAGCNAWDHVG